MMRAKSIRYAPLVAILVCVLLILTPHMALAAIAYESHTTAVLASNGTTLTIDVPSGTVAGDLLLAAVAADENPTIAATGWTSINQGAAPGNAARLAVFYRVATAPVPASYSFTWTGGQQAAGAMFRYSGVDTTTPLDVAAASNTGTTTAPTAPTITTVTNGARIVRIYAADDDDLEGSPYPASHIGRVNMESSDTSADSCSLGVAETTQATAGATGTAAFALLASQEWYAVTVALRPAAAPSGTIGGIVYRDFDADGIRDLRDPGLAGITVTAYDSAGTAVATATTNANGAYRLTGLTNGAQVRLEVTGLPAYLRPGPVGADCRTTVFFTASPVDNYNVGAASPPDYCQSNPNLVTTVFIKGDNSASTEDAAVRYPYSTDGVATITALADARDIGTVYGLAYQRSSNILFGSAYVKRGAGLGPANSTGAIYRMNATPPGVSLFLDLNATGATYTGPNPHPNGMTASWLYDAGTLAAVGKVGLGDLDISEDERTLYAVNLYRKELIAMPLGDNPAAPVAPTAGQIGVYPVPIPASCNGNGVTAPSSDDLRPFGLKAHDDLVYVGMVCTAQSMVKSHDPRTFAEMVGTTYNIRSSMRGYVYTFNPATSSFSASPVLEFALNYPRRHVNNSMPSESNNGEWLPWNDAWYPPYASINGAILVNPQPILADIEFDGEGYMMMGFRDRWSDQAYDREDPGPDGWTTLMDDRHGGDVLLAYWTGSAWTLESSGQAGARSTGDPDKGVTGTLGNGGTTLDTGSGPGDATNGYYEFYHDEHYDRDFVPDYHRELTLGSLAVLPGSGELVSTLFDAVIAFDNGTIVLDNNSGGLNRTAQLYDADYQFGKAGGVGDVELLCSAAPIEIGNRVWNDSDGDGIQDPGENPIANVTIRLYNAAGTLVASATTASDGTWYFRTASGLAASTQYFVVVDPAEFQSGGDLYGYSSTTLNAGTTLRDSDATGVTPIGLGSRVGLVYTTGPAGQNDHTLDMGFRGKVSLGNQIWNDQDNDGQYDAPVRVGDLVWYDVDGDGVQDAGEPGVAGVSVALYDNSTNRLLATATTDATGVYLFDNLPPGNYYVIFDLGTIPPGFSVTTPNAGGNDALDSDANQTTGQTAATGPLSAGQQNMTLDMGLVATGVVTVGDRAWYDLDRDGVQDAGELGVPGVRVELHPGSASNCNGRPLATTTTGDDGYYLFAGLAPASYFVCFDLGSLPAGYQATTQNAGSDDSADSDADTATGMTADTPSLTAGQADRSLDMGIRATDATTNSIGDKVWVDRNRDGDQDGGAEPGVPGVRVELHPEGASCSDMPLMVDVTDEFGNYLFDGLPGGSYFVCFNLGTLPSGYEVVPADQGGNDGQDSDANTGTGATPAVSVSGGTSNLTLDMGIRLTSASVVAVGDRVWLDADRDGIQDAGEPGVPGVNARLYQDGQSCVEGPTNNGGWNSGGTNNEWEHGTPSYATGLTTRCNSGSGCWATDLDDRYEHNSNQTVTSPLIATTGFTAPFRVTWAHAHRLGAGDSVYFERSCAGGGWTALYSATATEQAWITMRAASGCTAGQTIQLQAHLTSDNATRSDGYFIDDVSVRDANGALIYSQNFDPTPANAPMREEATDANGAYLFDNLPAGNYFVCFDRTTIPTGFEVTLQNQGGNDTVDSDANTTTGATASTGALSGGQSDLTLDMGIRSANASPVSVGDKVWYDRDRDGVQDAGEPGVEGVRVTLYADGSARPLASTITASNGQYLFAGLAPGSYYVIFDLTTLPAGYAVTTADLGGNDALDSDANTATGQTPVTGAIGAGGSNLTLDMGIILAGDVRVGDRVWYDDDRDGRQDAGESGVPGVTVYLHSTARSTSCADDPLGSTTTGADGRYLFANLAPGDYFVCFDLDTLPSGYQVSPANTQLDDNLDSDADAAGKTAPTGNLAAGRYDLSLDMGIYSTGNVSVGDYVWYDRDRDGIQDAGEAGVPGVTVELYRDGQTCRRDMPLAVTATGGDGRYLFDNLAAGSYFVCFDLTTLPAGYEVTTQNAGGDDALDSDANPTTGATASTGALSAGQSNLTLDMGIRQTATGTVAVGDRVWYDDDRDGVQDTGERGVPGVDVTLRAAGAGTCATAPVLATDTTDASGLYLFDGLTAGSYFVCFDIADLPAGYVVTGRNQGSDDGADSDADEVTGQTANTGALAAGEVDRSLDMGIYAPGHELPIPSVTVYLFAAATTCDPNGSGAIAVTVSDANGHYVFTNLPPGDYYVYIPASSFGSGGVLEYMVTSTGNDPAPDPDSNADNDDNGSAATGACAGGVSSGVVTLGVTQEPTNDGSDDPNTPDVSHNLTVDLGFFEPLAVGNLAWYDLDGDGYRDSGEPAIQNATIQLYGDVDGDGACEPGGDDGSALATDTTDANGSYEFLSLSPGSYCVHVPAGQFGSGQALAFDYSTATTEADPDSNVEDNDNGLDGSNTPATTGVSSGVFTLLVRTEPSDDTAADQPAGYRDSSANTTVDLGFVGFDLGDLPDHTCSPIPDYADTTFDGSPLSASGDNGARHLIWPAGASGRILLGAAVDVESNGQESCNAVGDDLGNGDDEDGVTQTGTWVRGLNGGSVDVIVTGGSGYLNAWIDWDGDGSLTDSGDQIFADEPVSAGSNALSFDIPNDAASNATLFARFRLDDQSGGSASPTGWASNGEDEDYRWDPMPTAVELVYFTATAGDSSILLAWETVSEIETIGFNLYRADSPDGTRIQLNDALIPGQAPGSPVGATYQFPDTTVEPKRFYYYWLEDVDIHGQTGLYGPVNALVGGSYIYLPLVIH